MANTPATASNSASKAEQASTVVLDGYSLTIEDVVAVARNGAKVQLTNDPAVLAKCEASVEFLQSKLHTSIYGVTTGFGGSADTRTSKVNDLQMALIEHQLIGVLPTEGHVPQPRFALSDLASNMMPEAIVRGAILIRINSLIRGHSGVRLCILDALVNLLNSGLTPCVPLRSSISASGDLSPLSYIAAAITAHPDSRVIDKTSGQIILTKQALASHNLTAVTLAAKEGLGLLNGTAFSASAASLALADTLVLAEMSKILTAMTLEAMVGNAGSFDPFIHDVCRPHEGQVGTAATIRSIIAGSKLITFEEEEVSLEADEGVLRQDRYPLRTSAQWIGPNVEALELARRQIVTELNSTTDNPILDHEKKEIHHGGNFQACSPAKAMEHARLALQQFGKLSFSQFTEMINCSMNRGLPSCLAGSDPSTNFHCKGLDIAAASYTAELGFLANPVTTHVQSAEMHNQAVNSLALVSARKTIEACEVLSLLMSTHLYAVCQGIDLRVAYSILREAASPALKNALAASGLSSSDAFVARLVVRVFKRLEENGSMDVEARFEDSIAATVSMVVSEAVSQGTTASFSAVETFKQQASRTLYGIWMSARDRVFSDSTLAEQYIAAKNAEMYRFVRSTLGIKPRMGDVHQSTVQHHLANGQHSNGNGVANGHLAVQKQLPVDTQMIGRHVSAIYESLRSGYINETVRAVVA